MIVADIGPLPFLILLDHVGLLPRVLWAGRGGGRGGRRTRVAWRTRRCADRATAVAGPGALGRVRSTGGVTDDLDPGERSATALARDAACGPLDHRRGRRSYRGQALALASDRNARRAVGRSRTRAGRCAGSDGAPAAATSSMNSFESAICSPFREISQARTKISTPALTNGRQSVEPRGGVQHPVRAQDPPVLPAG